MLGKIMLNDRIEVALQFSSEIRDIEASLNQSMERVGTLFAAIPAARAKLGKSVPLEAGLQAAESLAAVATGLAASYRSVIEAHGHLANDRDLLGLKTVGWGDLQACPKTNSDENAPPFLRAVDAA
jgi:hypothetical protein